MEALKKKTTDRNGKRVSHYETNKLVVVHYNIVNNNYQKDSRLFYTFVLNKLFGRLLDISPKSFVFLKILNSEYWFIEIGLSITILNH